jgi:hypothetical protein
VLVIMPVIAGITETIVKFLVDVIFWAIRLFLPVLGKLIP